MATLAQTVKQTKGLKQLAAQVKNVALFYAPKRTGNLKRRLNQANRAENMFKVIPSGGKAKISISLNVSPPGAEYGKWFNDPPRVVKRTKLKQTAERKGNWNFGKKAVNDPSVKAELDKFIKEFAKEYTKTLIKEIKT